MNVSKTAHRHPSEERNGSRRLAIFFIYLLLGPPIGGLIFTLGVSVLTLYAAFADSMSESPGGMAAGIFALFAVAIPFSYIFGGLQAAVTGVIISVYAPKGGRFGYRLAFVASLSASLLGAVIFARDAIGFGVILVTVGVLSGLGVRLVFSGLFRPDARAS